MNDFKGRHFGGEIALRDARWYSRYADFKMLQTAYATIKGFEDIHTPRHFSAGRRLAATMYDAEYDKRPISRAPNIGEIRRFFRAGCRGLIAKRTRSALRLLPHQRMHCEGLGTPRGAQHRQGADLCRRHRRTQGRGHMPEGDETPAGEVPQQCRGGRPRQAQATDSSRVRLQDDEDGLLHDQGLRGHAGPAQGSGSGFRPPGRHHRRGQDRRACLRRGTVRSD